MKKGLFFALCLVLVLPLIAIATDPPKNEITVYYDGSYSGTSSNMLSDYSNLVPIGWNDNISSIKIGTGILKVVLYQDINYKGKSREIKTNTDFSGNWWNDRISSFKIVFLPEAPPSNTVRFYWDKEYGGNYFDSTEENTNLVSSGWNDKISSIMLGSACEVKVFEHINCNDKNGKNMIIRTNTDLSGTWWNDRISSFRVVPK